MKFPFKRSGLMVGALCCAASLSLAAQTASPAQSPAKPAAEPVKIKPIEINGASRKALMTLPGINAALADKIIAGRPYLSKANLLSHKVVSDTTYAMIRTRIYVIPKLPVKK
jgi:DNA uptake protein ComE-like DNA-binding protein